jgi:hypothetical protein
MAFGQSVYYQGRTLNFSGDERPYTARGTTMVPARRTADMVGASLDRSDSGRQIRLGWHNNRVTYRQGDTWFELNGRRTNMGLSSEARRDILFVPAEMFRALTDGVFAMGPNGWNQRDDWNNGRWGSGDNNGRWGNGGNGRWDNNNGSWRTDPGYNGRYNDRGTVTLDGRALTFDYREQPYMKNGVVMVPFRAMGDKIGARTERTDDGLRVWIYMNGDRVEYDKGHTWYRLNSQQRDLRTVSEDRDNVLFVPITLFEAISRGRVRGN